jgi:hypothetical protein
LKKNGAHSENQKRIKQNRIFRSSYTHLFRIHHLFGPNRRKSHVLSRFKEVSGHPSFTPIRTEVRVCSDRIEAKFTVENLPKIFIPANLYSYSDRMDSLFGPNRSKCVHVHNFAIFRLFLDFLILFLEFFI